MTSGTANREKQREHARAWRLRNPDKVKAAFKKYYEKNKERIAARNKAYDQTNPSYKLEYNKRWREDNRERYNEVRRKWAAAHYVPKIRAKAAKRQIVLVVPLTEQCFNDALYATIAKLVPRYSSDVRDDLISAVYLGVLEGVYPMEVTQAHVKLEVTKHFRGSHETRSLDQKVFDNKTYGETIGIY